METNATTTNAETEAAQLTNALERRLDLLVAIDGIKVTSGNFDGLIAAAPAGEKLKIHAFRRDELMVFDLKMQLANADTWGLRVSGESAARKAWLA